MDKVRYLSALEYGTLCNAIAPTNNIFFVRNEADSCHLTKQYNGRSTGVGFYSTYRSYDGHWRECPYCAKGSWARYSLREHFCECKEFTEFYHENGLAQILMNSPDSKENKEAIYRWTEWIQSSGSGGEWTVYFITKFLEDPKPEDIVYLGVTCREHDRMSREERNGRFHSSKWRCTSSVRYKLGGKRLLYYRMEMRIDDSYIWKFHPTQAFALEQATTMLIYPNLLNNNIKPVKLCQSEYFSADRRQSTRTQLLAARHLLLSTLSEDISTAASEMNG